jgi:hypothetical protein
LVDDATIEKAITQKQGAARGGLLCLTEFVATEHPASTKVGAAPVLNPANRFNGSGLVADRSHWQHNLGGVIKGDECELVGGAKISNDAFAGRLGMGQRASSHGAAAVQNGAESHRAPFSGFSEGRCEFEGEMHGASLVGEDSGMVEVGLDFHWFVFLICVFRFVVCG